jgi:hypothetical protein
LRPVHKGTLVHKGVVVVLVIVVDDPPGPVLVTNAHSSSLCRRRPLPPHWGVRTDVPSRCLLRKNVYQNFLVPGGYRGTVRL